MKQIAWNDEVFINSASVESVRKIYNEKYYWCPIK